MDKKLIALSNNPTLIHRVFPHERKRDSLRWRLREARQDGVIAGPGAFALPFVVINRPCLMKAAFRNSDSVKIGYEATLAWTSLVALCIWRSLRIAILNILDRARLVTGVGTHVAPLRELPNAIARECWIARGDLRS